MATIVYAKNALHDLDRILTFVAETDETLAAHAVASIESAVGPLAMHPFIGRIVGGHMRELVVSFGRTGYVVLYRYVAVKDVVRVLGIKHQRELSFDL